MRLVFLSVFLLAGFIRSHAQGYTFAQLTGSPMNTTGWNLQGAASVGNVTGSGNSELILTQALTAQSGAIFFNTPVNLNQCNTWTVEFDFRMNGGNMADGMAFCFLDVPPVGFVSGGGLGIPATANGLKVCFDTYNNCGEGAATMPKIEIRWGSGYIECSTQPTLYNTGGNLDFLRSNSYNRAKVEYTNGTINVYVNNVLYLTGSQTFNFTGYFGFTASTGALNDIHSIKDVVIYTSMPPSDAGLPAISMCSGSTVTIGTTPNLLYTYNWTPTTGLSNPNAANPQLTLTNPGSTPVTVKYRVTTSYLSGTGCASSDSIAVTVFPQPTVNITSNTSTICSGTNVNFSASATNTGFNPSFQWFVNGVATGVTGTGFSSSTLANGDVVTCVLTTSGSCGPATSNAITMNVTSGVTPTVNITANNTSVCQGTPVQFTATTQPASVVSYQWIKNGNNVGSNSSTYTDNALNSTDQVSCTVNFSGPCLATTTANSNVVSVNVIAPLPLDLGPGAGFCLGNSVNLNAGTAFSTYQWSTGATGNNITVTSPGQYSVIGTSADGCLSYDTIDVFLHPQPTVSLGNSGPICAGDTRTLNAGVHSAYQWSDGSSGQTLTVNAPGTYTVTVLNNSGCTATSSITITGLNTPPSGFLPGDTAICSYGNLQLQAIQSFNSYNWSTGAATQQLTITQPGTYWLEVRDGNGCTGRDSVNVLPKQCMKGIYVPNAFSPNRDGRNDVFKPLVFGRIRNYEFIVYNRWGNAVFRTTTVDRGWNGFLDGASQGSDVFVWICKYEFEGEGPKVEKGTVLLVR